MKKKYNLLIKLFICAFILLGSSNCSETDTWESRLRSTTEDTQHTTREIILSNHDGEEYPHLQQQITELNQYTMSLGREAMSEINLVLGVNNREDNLQDRFDHSYIFLDIENGIGHTSRYANRSLGVDFNDLGQLEYLATKLPEFFDKIILDDSTFKYIAWSKEHLDRFKRILKPGGKFIFAPQYDILQPKFERVTIQPEEFINHFKEELQHRNHTQLEVPRCSLPYQFLVNKEFLKGLLCNAYTPVVYLPIVEAAFGEGNVEVAYDEPLPFHSNWAEKQQVIIIATRRAD